MTFEPTQQGTLQAIDETSGRILWTFAPPFLDSPTSIGPRGDVTALRFDADSDGHIDPLAGDRVWIYFGMRRRGRLYFALDVTRPDRYRLLWKTGPAELPGVGETWSRPSVARARIAGVTSNPEAIVLFVGGGYDPIYDTPGFAHRSNGNRIFMIDAASGRVLWIAGAQSADEDVPAPDLALERMRYAIAGRIVALDLDADGLADRLYAADLAAQVWRFDLYNGATRADFASGGVLASLGAADLVDSPLADARRFFFEPDVTLMHAAGGSVFANLALGSGDLAHPYSIDVHDRFYAVRDPQPFVWRTQSEHDARLPILDGDLPDISGHPDLAAQDLHSPGWKLDLGRSGQSKGQKSLGRAMTLDGTIIFTTYEPVEGDAGPDACHRTGHARVYALDIAKGRATLDLDLDGRLDADGADDFADLEETGIPGALELDLEWPSASSHATEPDPRASSVDSLGRRFRCRAGNEILRRCLSPGGLVRTFWYRKAVK